VATVIRTMRLRMTKLMAERKKPSWDSQEWAITT
jgi:hypothetical protein